jgi:diacylglycerol kinase (ATP)
VSLEVDGAAAYQGRVTTVALANGKYQGGGMLVAPLADPADGLMDLTVVEEVGLATLAKDAGMLYSGTVYAHPKVRHFRGVRLRADGGAPFECDGEAVGRLPVEVEVVAGAWRVLGQ